MLNEDDVDEEEEEEDDDVDGDGDIQLTFWLMDDLICSYFQSSFLLFLLLIELNPMMNVFGSHVINLVLSYHC